jgi:lipoprotein-releasing system permease protein
LNPERFIAFKMIWGSAQKGKSSTKPIVRISVFGIALGVAVMVLSLSIVTGFQNEIRSKVIGFGGHIQLRSYSLNTGLDDNPISIDQPFYPSIQEKYDEVENIQVFANKAGILKTQDEIAGVVVKGIGQDFNWAFFEQNLKEGQRFTVNSTSPNDSIIISEFTARQLKLKLYDKIFVYFIQDGKPRPRKFYISGIYSTGMKQFDEKIVIADIQHIQRINQWNKDQVGGFEINLKNYEDLFSTDYILREEIGFDLKADRITERFIEIFSWLNMQDTNVVIILSLMILVSAVTMTTALLILILDRTQMIGILKSMGASNWVVRKVFLYNAAYLILKGLFWGNLIGLTIAFLQLQFGFITLDEEVYYLSQVPININWLYLLLLNVGTLTLCTLMMIVPSVVITKISPVKAIRFN